jgi:hypothetical protein
MRALLALAVLTLVAGPAGAQDMDCPYNPRLALATRPSPLDSLSFTVGGETVKICYGRPSLKGRVMIGPDDAPHPFGKVWRTGANETTKFIATAPVMVGSLAVPAGMYALYAIPGESEWQLILNKSHEQWGHERNYTDEVQAQDLGRVTVTPESLADVIETFTIRAEPQADGSVHLILEWEHTRVRVPVIAKP